MSGAPPLLPTWCAAAPLLFPNKPSKESKRDLFLCPSRSSAGLKVIKKKLVRKAIDMIKKLADGEVKARKEVEEKKEEGERGGGGGCSRAGGCGTCVG